MKAQTNIVTQIKMNQKQILQQHILKAHADTAWKREGPQMNKQPFKR